MNAGTTTRNDQVIANTILNQIGFMVRGCLDIKGTKAFIIENGMLAKNVIVTPRNNRGDIRIVLNALDLYDIEVTRHSKAKGTEVIRRYDNIFASDLRQVLDNLWR